MKHAVWRRVKSYQVIINTPRDFAEYANSILLRITVIYADTPALDLQYHEECRALAIEVKGTQKVHHIKRVTEPSATQLSFHTTSKSDPFTSVTYDKSWYQQINVVIDIILTLY